MIGYTRGVEVGTKGLARRSGPRRMLMAHPVERHAERTGSLSLNTAATTPVAAALLTEPPQISPVEVTDIAIFFAGLVRN